MGWDGTAALAITYNPPMSHGTILVARAGAALVVLGLLLVAFVAYQLWGTALYESQAQARLRRELAQELGGSDGRGSTGSPRARAGRGSTGHPRHPLRPAASPAAGPAPAPAPAAAEPDPPIGSPVGVLTIPAIGLDDVVVEGVGEPQLAQGPGHYPGTPLPGERGNVGIAGHRTTYARPFYDLNRLRPGDAVDVRTPQGFFRYTVVGSQVVPPTDVGVLDPRGDAATLTLTTCNPRYSAATRLVVTAVFSPGASGAPAAPAGAGAAPAGRPAPSRGPVAPAVTAAALDGGSGDYGPGILWGLVTVALAAGAWLAWRRGPRLLRWPALVAGVPLAAASLLLCFQYLSLALPASF